MFGIIGSGFGLYGYLPALLKAFDEEILLPVRYAATFASRPELQAYSHRVRFASDEDEVLDRVSGAVIAQRAVDQPEWIARCLRRAQIQRLVLEKPLAATPDSAAAVLRLLYSSNRSFRVGYLFRFTGWGRRFLKALASLDGQRRVSIEWRFRAHHFLHDMESWKRMNSRGGGVVRFFGIQVIALLAEAGFDRVVWSRVAGHSAEEIDRWTATLAGRTLPECDIILDTRSAERLFRVSQPSDSLGTGVAFADLNDPFESILQEGGAPEGGLDRRVGLLAELCGSLCSSGAVHYQMYDATIELWREIELKTRFEQTPSAE